MSGWIETSARDGVETRAQTCARRGAAAIVFTDIRRDGTGRASNVAGDARARRASERCRSSPRGGVGSLDDVRRARAVDAGGVAA